MNVKRLVIGTIVGAIALLVVGWVMFELLLGDFYRSNMSSLPGVVRATPLYWSLVIGQLIYALLISLALEAKRSAYAIGDGFTVGATVGVLLWGSANFTLYALVDVNNLMLTIVDSLLAIVQAGIAGAVIAWVVGLIGSKSSTASTARAVS